MPLSKDCATAFGLNTSEGVDPLCSKGLKNEEKVEQHQEKKEDKEAQILTTKSAPKLNCAVENESSKTKPYMGSLDEAVSIDKLMQPPKSDSSLTNSMVTTTASPSTPKNPSATTTANSTATATATATTNPSMATATASINELPQVKKPLSNALALSLQLPPPPSSSLDGSKKRKPNPVVLADSHVVELTQHVLELLQLLGPLTQAQIKHHLPPPRSTMTRGLLEQVLELLVATGVVRVVFQDVQDPHLSSPSSDSNNNNNTSPMASKDGHDGVHAPYSSTRSTALKDPPPRPQWLYCIFGKPRQDVIFPHQALPALEAAHAEYQASLERGDKLKHYLLQQQQRYQDQPSQMEEANHRLLLQKMYKDYPEIAYDPVYLAALRNVGIQVDLKVNGGSAET